MRDFGVGESECFGDDVDCGWFVGRSRNILAEEDAHRGCEDVGGAGEDADGVEAGGEGHHAGDGDGAVRGPHAPQAAVAGRDADGAAGVGAEGEVGEAARDGGGGAAGGAAGDAIGRSRVERRAVEEVFADQAEGELIANGFADAGGAGREQLLDADGRRAGRRVSGEPIGIAAAGGVVGDVDEVFDGEA